MFQDFRVYDADAHVIMSPKAWEDLPPEYEDRRPRPVRVTETEGMGRWNTGWLMDGRMQPHPFGPATQGANTPKDVLEDFGASPKVVESIDLSNPEARIRDIDQAGIDIQFLFPTTLYANATLDATFEAALCRAYNRYVGRQCKPFPKRLKWAGLLPLRNARQGCEALQEMQTLGATAAVVYGTAGEYMLSDPSFTPVWDELYRSRLPLCVHMGMSYPPFERLCQSRLDAHAIGMSLPAVLAFVAIVGHGMLDRYPDLKVAFLEFGAEWLFYMVGRIGHYLPTYRTDKAIKTLPQRDIGDYLKSGRVFVAPEAEDPMLHEEMELVGENQVLFASDYPHGEARENAANELVSRADLTRDQKAKFLYDNAVRFYGEP